MFVLKFGSCRMGFFLLYSYLTYLTLRIEKIEEKQILVGLDPWQSVDVIL